MIIGLLGTKGAGKDTCADFLCEHHNFIRIAFADALKRACQELFLLSDEQVFGTQEQKETPDPRWFGATPRKILQFIGTDLLRDNMDKIMPGLGKNVFTHYVKIWCEEQMEVKPSVRIVITDVRFQNEVDFIKSMGGRVIKIERHAVNSGDQHISEMEVQSIKNYDRSVQNNVEGNLNNLYENLLNAVFDQ